MSYMVETMKDEIYKALQNDTKKIILDLNQIDYIDSLGIGAIIEVFKKIRALKGEMVIINMSKPVLRLIRMLNVEKFLNIADKLEDAVKFLKVNNNE